MSRGHVVEGGLCWCGQEHVLISRITAVPGGTSDYRMWGDGARDEREHVIEAIRHRADPVEHWIECRCGARVEPVDGSSLGYAMSLHRGKSREQPYDLRPDVSLDLAGNEASIMQGYLALHYVLFEQSDEAFGTRWPLGEDS